MSVWTTTVASPLGPLRLVADGDGALTHLLFGGPLPRWVEERGPRVDPAPFVEVAAQLDGYFAGERTRFDLPLAPHGTPFQRAVWSALVAIPYGSTSTYGRQAAAVGRPSAARAVGAANGQTPVAIILPCHRVVGASGALTGYGGGVERKRWLLAHERGERPLPPPDTRPSVTAPGPA